MNGYKIMIVDDEADILSLLRRNILLLYRAWAISW